MAIDPFRDPRDAPRLTAPVTLLVPIMVALLQNRRKRRPRQTEIFIIMNTLPLKDAAIQELWSAVALRKTGGKTQHPRISSPVGSDLFTAWLGAIKHGTERKQNRVRPQARIAPDPTSNPKDEVPTSNSLGLPAFLQVRD